MFAATALLQSLRPRQWVKNIFVFAALIFDHHLREPGSVVAVLLAFLAFCTASSAVYLLNDLVDREADRRHRVKRRRPIASGALPPAQAAIAAAVLTLVAVGGGFALGTGFGAILSAYLLMNVAYSLALKRVVILDVMIVAGGFLLRAWGGTVVLGVDMSRWLVLCTGLIALFLGFAKRRQELVTSGAALEQRPILREYSLPFLDQMIGIVTASTLLAYSLYAFSPEVAEKLGTRWMGATIPFVLFGIFRYLYLVHQRGEGENPTILVLSDVPLLLTVLSWGGAVTCVLYLL